MGDGGKMGMGEDGYGRKATNKAGEGSCLVAKVLEHMLRDLDLLFSECGGSVCLSREKS